MLIWIFEYLKNFFPIFDIHLYIVFRTISCLITAFILSLFIGFNIISFFKEKNFSQKIKKTNPNLHLNKCNIPTMGGLSIIISVFISVFFWSYLSNPYIWFVLFIFLGYGCIGFFDDYYKINKKKSSGLLARWKYFWQSIIAFILIIILFLIEKKTGNINFFLPFLKKKIFYINYCWYILISYFVIVGTSNAVNLTDGLDGLAIMPVIFVSLGLAFVSWITSNENFSIYLNIPYVFFANELIIFCAAIVGSCLGFLWFNAYPAKIFMGDIGSLSLGGAIGTISILIHQEFLFFIMSGIFVVETISVILQIISFKIFGKRLFYMAPIHHHYELKGFLESRIVIQFWIVSLIFVLIGISMLII